MTHRFEVGYKERLEQSRTASNAVRLPRLGYKLYRIYDIEKPKNLSHPSYTMNVSAGRQNGKTHWTQVLWAYIYELESRTVPAYEVRWLKPKRATLLRMRGHRVEPAAPDDRPGRFQERALKVFDR